MLVQILYLLVVFILSLYSYALIDPNITYFNNQIWAVFREKMVYFGYYQRPLSVIVYLILIIGLFVFHHLILKNDKRYHPLKLAVIIGLITLLSYPFLSHDFFNYLFDAKILTYYHQNPYLHQALDYPHDQWLRFMHWTDRKYVYGPIFLVISAIPSFFSFGKFILDVFLFKILIMFFYLLGVGALEKHNKKQAMIFATHPLIIVEGLVNNHNDLIGVSLGLIGVYYLLMNKNMWGRIFFLFSGMIKYITLPLMVLTKKNRVSHYISLFLLILLVLYLCFFNLKEIQPWYFLTFFSVLPFFNKWFEKFSIFAAGLLFSYFPYIRFGGWDKLWKVTMKHQIIIVFLIINLLYFLLIWSKKKFFTK